MTPPTESELDTLQSQIDMREAAYSAIAKYGQLREPKEQNYVASMLAGHVLKLLDEIEELETTIALPLDGLWTLFQINAEYDMFGLDRIVSQHNEQTQRLQYRVNELEKFVRHVYANYDCDVDSHKYGTPCRCCDANKLMSSRGAHECKSSMGTITSSSSAPAKESDDRA